MSYTQFGYSSYTTSSPLVLGSSSGQTPCYERTGVSPESQYDTRLYPRLPTYASTYQPEPASLDPAATTFYAPTLNSTYGMKESPDPWRSISQSASYYYDPTLAAYGYGGLDFNGARRKNVTRDSTSTLKAWLNEHRKNPYPTKGEKIMLAIITKMTLTQVSTWFANARRRLKKENKMTWEPRNKAESSHDEDGPKREQNADDDTSSSTVGCKEEPPHFPRDDAACGEKALRTAAPSMQAQDPSQDIDLSGHHRSDNPFRPSHADHPPQPLHPQQQQQHYEDSHPAADMLSAASSSLEATSSGYTPSSQSSSPDLDSYLHHRGPKDLHPSQQCYQSESYKPKIWSLADTATNKAALMPYDLCPQTGGWLGGSGMTSGSAGGCAVATLKTTSNPGNSFQSCSAMRFGNYGCFNPISLQTDTPPQTPPNMKVSAAHQAATATAVPSSAYIETHAAYIGQPTLCPQDAMAEAQMQGEKVDGFSNSHGSGLAQTSSSNPNSDCISEEYDDPSQYSTPNVR